MSQPKSLERTALYRLYDADRILLYIGITKQPDKRFKQHAQNQNWWHLVVRSEIHWLDSRDEALAVEAKAVQAEKPRFDATHRFQTGEHRYCERVVYDDSADEAAVIAALQDDIASGAFAPGAYLQAGPIGERYGYSKLTTGSAMYELAKRNTLIVGGKGFYVP